MFTTLVFWEAVRVGRQRYHWPLRVAVALAMTAAMILIFLIVMGRQQSSSGRTAEFGRWFFSWVALMQFSVGVTVGLAFSAAGMIDERNRGTLSDALSMGVGPIGFIGSKALVAMARSAETTILLSPFAAVCILLGGTSLELVLFCAVVTLSASFLAVGLGSAGGVFVRSLPEALAFAGVPMMVWYMLPAIMPFLGIFLAPRVWAYNAPYQLNYWSMADPRSVYVGLIGGVAALLAAAARLRKAASPESTLDRKQRVATPLVGDGLEWLHGRIARRPASRWMRLGITAVATLAAGVVLRDWLVGRQAVFNSEPQYVTSAAAFMAFINGLFVLPSCLLAGASLGGLERSRQVRDLILLSAISERELLQAKGRTLRRWCIGFATPGLLLAGLCVVLGWTTPVGALIAFMVCSSAMLLCAAAGLRLGWASRRPAGTAAALAVGGVVLFGACPLILYTSALPRTTAVYHSFTPFAPALHPGLILCVDHQGDFNPNVYCTDGPLTLAAVRTAAVVVSLVYLAIAAGFFLWPTGTERRDAVSSAVAPGAIKRTASTGSNCR